METSDVILHGGGEHARVVLDCLLSNGVHVAALFDPKYSGSLMGIQQRGTYDPNFHPHAKAIVSIGSNAVRKKAVSVTKHTFTNAVHNSALISRSVVIGVGNMILHGAIVQAFATLGNHVIVNTRAQIDHDCVLGDFTHVAPGCILCGTVEVGEGTLIGAGAVVLPGRKIGKWATIGAGAVITKDVADFSVVVGNPGRVVKSDNS